MDIRPQDLPKLRTEVIQEIKSVGPRVFTRGKHRDYPAVAPTGYVIQQEVRRIQAAELFYVSPGMGALAKAAGPSLPYFQVQPEDCPAPSGLVFFPGPRLVHTYSGIGDREVTLRALGWGQHTHPKHGAGILITRFVDADELRACAIAAGKNPSHYNYGRTISYDFDGSFFWPYTPDPATEAHWGPSGRVIQEWSAEQDSFVEQFAGAYKGYIEANFASSCLLRSTWLLMQQPLAEVSEAEPPTSLLGSSKCSRSKKEPRKPRPVRVIELRRPKSSGEHGGGESNYQYQWIVRGHWRNHWHPKRQVHRPVWIAPHVKGPEGAPMIGGEKVYAWKR